MGNYERKASFKLLARYVGQAALDLGASAVAILASPVLALFAKNVQGKHYLTGKLSGFQTPDNPLEGDAGWQNEHWQWRHKLHPVLARYVGFAGWIARNPAYGFAEARGQSISRYDYLGHSGSLLTRDKPEGHEGYLFMYACSGYSMTAFEYLSVKRIGKTRCLKLNFGWTLRDIYEAGGVPGAQGVATAPLTLSVRLTRFQPA